jgi:large subunit ribosomal protein L31
MRKGIHPENYRLVAFKDMSNDDVFITKSTAETKETIDVDGETYPLVKLEISRSSHPYYTGKSKLVDTAGRIDKFKNKYKKFKKEEAPSQKEETPARDDKSKSTK